MFQAAEAAADAAAAVQRMLGYHVCLQVCHSPKPCCAGCALQMPAIQPIAGSYTAKHQLLNRPIIGQIIAANVRLLLQH
jgi:hypothetical protein